MMPIHAQKSVQTLAELPLSLYEQLAQIPRALEANLTGSFAEVYDSAISR